MVGQILPCENHCGGKAGFKKEYDAYLCNTCRDKMESRASRVAINAIRKNWRDRK